MISRKRRIAGQVARIPHEQDGAAQHRLCILGGARTSKTDVGSLMPRYGGGGHHAVGTCQISHDDADKVIEGLGARLDADG